MIKMKGSIKKQNELAANFRATATILVLSVAILVVMKRYGKEKRDK